MEVKLIDLVPFECSAGKRGQWNCMSAVLQAQRGTGLYRGLNTAVSHRKLEGRGWRESVRSWFELQRQVGISCTLAVLKGHMFLLVGYQQ